MNNQPKEKKKKSRLIETDQDKRTHDNSARKEVQLQEGFNEIRRK